jgi:3',5'-cyclic AMP phosphodiesterase CpdA
MPEKILVVSDLHGDIVPFVSVLQGAGVVNKQLDWSFGQGHLVVLGDVSDRGDDVTALYWLIYKLEDQARKAGGVVHLLLGNHEVMVAQNDLRYITQKYKDVAQKLDMEYCKLWSNQSLLGKWINSRNQMEVIGDMLFVHAGVSPQVAATNLKIEHINDTIRKYIQLERNASVNSPVAELIMRTNGTLWYRGLVQPNEEVNDSVINAMLDRFGVKKIIVGHTMLDHVSQFFDGKVVDVNVNNKRNMERGLSRGVIITPNDLWVVDDNGKRMDFGRP